MYRQNLRDLYENLHSPLRTSMGKCFGISNVLDEIVDIVDIVDTVDIIDIIEIVHAVVMVGIVDVVDIDITNHQKNGTSS